ncbi:hypothetical protein SRABI26_03183 [Arthrobacter sp. Bi26]|nr:hypothetical protein SRABI26_03183 [Arthrobacter sp. Bi26]
MGPDGRLRLEPGGRAGIEGAGGALEIGHVLHRYRDGQVPVLPRRRGHNFHRRRSGEELSHQLFGFHGGRKPDALGGLGQQRVEPFQRHRQMRPALGPGDGVDLVDNDRVDLTEGFARLGRQHQEEGFRGGDEDIGRVAEQRAAVGRRRVPGPDAHGNERGGQVQAFGGLRDADQRCAEVAFDVDAESLERGNVQHSGLPLGCLPLG